MKKYTGSTLAGDVFTKKPFIFFIIVKFSDGSKELLTVKHDGVKFTEMKFSEKFDPKIGNFLVDLRNMEKKLREIIYKIENINRNF